MLRAATSLITLLLCSSGGHGAPAWHAQPRTAQHLVASTSQAAAAAPQHVVLPHTPVAPPGAATTRVDFFIWRPPREEQAQHKQPQLPLLFMMNGANVEARHYSQLAALLASKGYTVAGADYLQPMPPELGPSPGPCHKGRILSATAALLNTFVRYARASGDPGLQTVEQRGVVLLAHSWGGTTAVRMLARGCANDTAFAHQCEGYQPTLRTASCGAPPGAARRSAGLVLGAIAFEGFLGTERGTPPRPVAADVHLAPGSFLLLLGGAFNRLVLKAFEATDASACGACAAVAVYQSLNHYGLCNWQAPRGATDSHQITPCGIPSPADPPGFSIRRAQQEAALHAQAGLIDLFLRARVLQDAAAAQALARQAAEPGAAAGVSLRLKPQCLVQQLAAAV